MLESALLTRLGFAHGFSTRPWEDAACVSERRVAAESRVAGTDTGEHSEAATYVSSAIVPHPDARVRRALLLRLAAHEGVAPQRVYAVRQVHGCNVAFADGDRDAMLACAADAVVACAPPPDATRASVTSPADVAVTVRVADCVPVLVANETTGACAAIHAGWRGVVSHVVHATLTHLGDPERLVAAIGPCIGPCCFEVGIDVATQIGEAVGGTSVVARRFSGPQADKAFVDLRAAVRAQLERAGVAPTRIDDVPAEVDARCTFCNPHMFHSYRRDGEASGRMVAAIAARR